MANGILDKFRKGLNEEGILQKARGVPVKNIPRLTQSINSMAAKGLQKLKSSVDMGRLKTSAGAKMAQVNQATAEYERLKPTPFEQDLGAIGSAIGSGVKRKAKEVGTFAAETAITGADIAQKGSEYFRGKRIGGLEPFSHGAGYTPEAEPKRYPIKSALGTEPKRYPIKSKLGIDKDKPDPLDEKNNFIKIERVKGSGKYERVDISDLLAEQAARRNITLKGMTPNEQRALVISNLDEEIGSETDRKRRYELVKLRATLRTGSADLSTTQTATTERTKAKFINDAKKVDLTNPQNAIKYIFEHGIKNLDGQVDVPASGMLLSRLPNMSFLNDMIAEFMEQGKK